jgi:hypothetical protein
VPFLNDRLNVSCDGFSPSFGLHGISLSEQVGFFHGRSLAEKLWETHDVWRIIPTHYSKRGRARG